MLPRENLKIAKDSNPMKRIIVALTFVIVVIALMTVGFIWGRNTNIKGTEATGNDDGKRMKDLTVRNDLQKFGIEIIASTDENFSDELRRHLGESDELMTLVESARPFAFFVRNNSQKEIVGVSLRWKFVASNGQIFEIPQSEANPGVLMGMKPLDPKLKGKTSLINRKDTKFFSYFKEIVGQRIALAKMLLENPSIRRNLRADVSQSDISNMNAQKANILNSYINFSVSVDGVVFDDGAFVGEDQNFFFDTLSGDMQARKDILSASTEARLSGKKDAEILDGILSETSRMSANLMELRPGNATRERTFDFSYKTYLRNLQRELIFRRSRLSDGEVIKQLQSTQVSDFVTLYKAR